jgi:hypothetical protein
VPPKHNPLKLNPLQLKTLAILQEMAHSPATASAIENDEVLISNIPKPHGNHFHVGRRIVMTKDASGLENEAVWVALERRGLARSMHPMAIALTKAGQEYPTGIAEQILLGSDH